MAQIGFSSNSMKNIPNLTFEIPAPDKTNSTTASLLRACLAVPSDQGLSFNDMRSRLKIADLLEKLSEGGEIALEDADFATAVKVISAMKWTIPHKELVRFAEQFGL